MEKINRTSFQGITNIIRFNWHFYAFAFAFVLVLFFLKEFLTEPFSSYLIILIFLAFFSTVLSLAASYYIYDCSDLYTLNWLNHFTLSSNTSLVNIHAGFDETSALLLQKFPDSCLTVFDFYDSKKHTEISIERARKAYPAYPGTKKTGTQNIPLKKDSVDLICLILSAHEIRQTEERISFFQQLENSLKTNGKIIVVEHLRDLPNFLVYNFGFLHFHSEKTWLESFKAADLTVTKKTKITPFISTFTLKKNGSAS